MHTRTRAERTQKLKIPFCFRLKSISVMFVCSAITTFSRAIRGWSQGRCYVWLWLSFSVRLFLSCFTIFQSLDYFHQYTAYKTGRLVEYIVQVNSLFRVMGQETCQ